MTLRYERGHEMSGFVRLSVRADGTAEASRSGRGNLDPRSASGSLTDEQQSRLAAAIEDADLAHLAGSTRNIGDDEVPVLVALGEGAEQREVRIWSGDARRNERFTAFEAVVRELVDELLAGEA